MIPVLSDVISFFVDRYQILFLFPIFIASISERNFTGRPSIVANTASMFITVAPYWDATRGWLNVFGLSFFHAYLLLGLPVGAIAFLSYVSDESLSSDFYTLGWVLYNSAFAGIVCLLTAIYF